MEQKELSPASTLCRDELASWKEIAHYLSVHVRTAQKLERERGLPVRRAAGRRGRVSANISALETWQRQLAGLSKREDRCYRWPLGHAMTVELRFLGVSVAPSHVDLLCEYLSLFKTSL